MSKKIALYIIICFLTSNISIAQNTQIKWHSLTEAFELAKKTPRPIILDVYTDWCSWCKHMNKTTFSNKSIANYINNYFYAAKFNAEVLDTIEFKGKTYINRKIGRRPTHDLAIKLLDGKLSYPTIVFFSKDGQKMVVPGYKEPKDIEAFLVYFAENVGTTASINDFMLNYMYSFPYAFSKDHSIFKIDNALKPDTLGKINWIAPEEVLNKNKNKKNKKPIMLYFYTDWCISCKVMNKTTFGNSELAEQINSHYHPVKINAASENEINFLGKTYKGTGKNNPNELVKALLDNYKMPAMVIFDENNKLITRINGYFLSNQMIPLTTYFYKKMYEKLSFQDYLKTYNAKVKNQ